MSAPAPRKGGFAKRLLGFIGLPLLSSLSPFLVLPLLARLGGVQGWAAIGVGQSVGALAAMLVLAGWSLHGPALVASAPDERARVHYGDSLIGRSAVLLVFGPIAAIVGAALAPAESRVLAALTAVTFSLSGMSPAWFCIGRGRPGWIALYEVGPRLAGVAVSVVLLVITRNVLVYPLVVLGSTLTGIALFSIRIGRIQRREGLQLRRVLRGLWDDRMSALAVGIGGIYSTTPVAIMSLVLAVPDLARFSSADRLFRIGLFGVVSLGGALQGWVAEDPTAGVNQRMRRGLAAHVGLGIVGGIGLAVLAPPVSSALFGSAVAVPPLVAVFYGVAYAAIAVNTSTGSQILIPLGAAKGVFWSTAAGAASGVAGMIVFAVLLGPAGGAAGLALGEVVVCAVQLAAIRLRLNRSAPVPRSSPASVIGR